MPKTTRKASKWWMGKSSPNPDGIPSLETLKLAAALRAAKRARAIAATQDFDYESVRRMLDRVERELQEMLIDAGMRESFRDNTALSERRDVSKAA